MVPVSTFPTFTQNNISLMKSFKTIAATIIACATIHAASAAVIVWDVTINSAGPINPSVDFQGFPDGPQAPFSVLPGVWLSYNGATIVQSGSNSEGAAPFPSSPGNDYLSVKSGGLATFAFDSVWDRFAFQWGSIDSYNEIKFFNGVSTVGTFTGDDITTPANGFQGSGGSAYVVFRGLFDRVELRSINKNSFEIDNVFVSVPDAGSSVALLGLALLGLAGFARRNRA